MRQRIPRYRRRARRTLATTFAALLVLGVGVALAWTSSTQNPGTAVTALVLPDPSSLAAVKVAGGNPNRCANGVDVTWTLAPAPVNAQVLESRVGAGPWEPHAVGPTDTSYSDPRNLTGEVTYRLRGQLLVGGNPTNWLSPGIEASLICGNGPGGVYDLGATKSGCGVDLAWSAATNATTYDIQYSTDAGANWTTIVDNHAGTTYTATGVGGASVDFQVRPGIGGGTDGDWSNTATVTDVGIRVTAITIGGDGDGSIEVGETIAVTFSAAADPTTPSGSDAATIRFKKNGPGTGRGMYISASSVAIDSTAVGLLRTSALTMPGQEQSITGSAGWSAGDTVWTWTRTQAGSLAITPTWSDFAVGTSAADPARVQCAGGGTLGDSTPTVNGVF